MLDYDSLCRILPSFAQPYSDPVSLTFYRAVALHYLWNNPTPQPLYAEGAARTGARFTPRGAVQIRSLYFAADAETCLYEVYPLYLLSRRKHPPKSVLLPPTVLLSVSVRLTAILDIANPDVQNALGTSREELRAGWRLQQEQGETLTQRLGRAAFDCNIQALRYESARSPKHFCYAIFPELLGAEASAEVYDPHNQIPQRWAS